MDPVSLLAIFYVAACATVNPVVFTEPHINPPGRFLVACKAINDWAKDYPSLHPDWGQPTAVAAPKK